MKPFFAFLLSLVVVLSYSRNTRTGDSLENLLRSAKEDTQKIQLLYKLYNVWSDINQDTAIQYAGQALAVSKKIHSEKNIAKSYRLMGMGQQAKGKYDKALEFFLQSLKISEEIGDKKLTGASLLGIGNIYYLQGAFDKAIEYYFSAAKLLELLNDKPALAAVYGNMGNVYSEKKDFEQSLAYHKKSLAIEQTLKNKEGIATSLQSIGNVYGFKEDYVSAIYYSENALKLFEETNSPDIAACLINLGIYYTKQKKYSQAEKSIKRALDISIKSGVKDYMKECYNSLSDVYAAENNFKNAYEYHKLYSDTKDSLLNEESSKQIAEMQTKYETEKKEQQITLLNKDKELQDAQLNRQKIVIWSVAGGFLIVFVLSIFIFRERKKSEKLLLNILPVETARELKANGKATAKHYESVTVMFTDFKGFTTIAEKLSAEELVSELDFLFKKFDEIISKYNIEKIKTIGDAYMCASGLPTPNSNHAEEIVKAGIEIQSWMKEQNNKWSLRMGIHSGPVTA
ncbi:MAG: tetratricopeptide repeat protein, partial [Bacteroidetes bacterium]|nr:tetratricopeptide repeat protein [Bacteroidota bacterium]